MLLQLQRKIVNWKAIDGNLETIWKAEALCFGVWGYSSLNYIVDDENGML